MRKIILLFTFIFLAPFVLCHTEQDLSMLLGGMVKSDKWIIRKDSFEEEFIGNVHYENEMYKISADKALSKRKDKTYELSGKVFLSRTEDDTVLTLNANRVFYNQKKDKGFAERSNKAQVKIVYTTPENVYTLLANKVEFSNKANFFKATGKVQLSDKENTLKAEEITFDRITGIFEALSARPIMLGKNKDGSYALEADKMIVNTKTGKFNAIGTPQGWLTLEKDLMTQENLKKLKE